MTSSLATPTTTTTKVPWQPTIVAFVCNWCTYAGADSCGTMRREYPATVRLLRVPCTGRMSPLFVLKAFAQGADGVLCSGCHPGDCHYVKGNYHARRRFAAMRALFDFLGIDGRRLHFSWVSASEGLKWARVVGDVSAAVTAAGPFPGFQDLPPAAPDLVLPPIPPAPRPLPPAAEHDAIGEHVRALAKQLLADGTVATVLGHGPGTLPGRMVPLVATKPEHAAKLAWNAHCHTNLAAYLAGPRRPAGRIAVVVKACDARAALGLVREGKLAREDVVLLGVSCGGVADRTGDGLAPKCHPCDGELPAGCDYTISPTGVLPGSVPGATKRKTGPDPRDARVAAIEQAPPEARFAFWQRQFADCIRCNACRGVCPSCYCDRCIAEQHRPQWIPAGVDGKGNFAWNFIRAYHLSGRCVGCDECARVCPAEIPLDLVNRRIALEIERRFGAETEAPPLSTFRLDDPQEFIR